MYCEGLILCGGINKLVFFRLLLSLVVSLPLLRGCYILNMFQAMFCPKYQLLLLSLPLIVNQFFVLFYLFGFYFAAGFACKQLMSFYNGNFHKLLLKLTDSNHREVQYNCAGIIGHLAMNGKCSCLQIQTLSIICVFFL